VRGLRAGVGLGPQGDVLGQLRADPGASLTRGHTLVETSIQTDDRRVVERTNSWMSATTACPAGVRREGGPAGTAHRTRSGSAGTSTGRIAVTKNSWPTAYTSGSAGSRAGTAGSRAGRRSRPPSGRPRSTESRVWSSSRAPRPARAGDGTAAVHYQDETAYDRAPRPRRGRRAATRASGAHPESNASAERRRKLLGRTGITQSWVILYGEPRSDGRGPEPGGRGQGEARRCVPGRQSRSEPMARSAPTRVRMG
jgi:hypothetical protein